MSSTIAFSQFQVVGYESDRESDSNKSTDSNPFAGMDVEQRAQEVTASVSTVEVGGQNILLSQDLGGGCGGKTWEAAFVMADYFAWKQNLHGKRIIELGSGTGLVGLAIAKMFALDKMLITDQRPMLGLMHENIRLNQLSESVQAGILDWGEPLPDDANYIPDVILASDCVYLEVAFQPLLDTLMMLADQKTDIYLSYRKRRKADKRFFQLARKKFVITEIRGDHPKQEIYGKQGLHLYLFKKK
ncbi:hypothetical protein DFQ28_010609 [Apophysomyces sp. BC1034]|nr:hypothetical protein DFQ30_010272 [Apophysomyces sp. BC1015]KAG0181500.1 hypothetical protein DFQ29_008169 [Apophysomyces sp. BC1021]KAG0191918.1 hypothetical protein DFQ28_010609 [Apophysomyces sp. BC1034]